MDELIRLAAMVPRLVANSQTHVNAAAAYRSLASVCWREELTELASLADEQAGSHSAQADVCMAHVEALKRVLRDARAFRGSAPMEVA